MPFGLRREAEARRALSIVCDDGERTSVSGASVRGYKYVEIRMKRGENNADTARVLFLFSVHSSTQIAPASEDGVSSTYR